MKKLSLIFFKLIVTACYLLIAQLSIAQKEKNESIVSQSIISKIVELVKPLQDQFSKQLNSDETGNFKMYQSDVAKMNTMKNSKERNSIGFQIKEKYANFFKEIWVQANVDEKLYQQKIKQLFPDAIRSQIQFDNFLNFSVTNAVTSSNTTSTVFPEDKCIDVCKIAAGEINGTSGLISSGAGNYGNCYLTASAWGAAIGKNELYGFLRNTITIPGTLPLDTRKLRVRKTYEVKMEATSFAVLGFGYAETRASTYQTNNYLFVMSPVIFGASKILTKTVNEDYLLDKVNVNQSILKTYAGTMAAFISGSWCNAAVSNIRWTICEEK